LICHQSCYRPPPSGVLGKTKIKKTFKLLLYHCWALLSFRLFSRALNEWSSFLHPSPKLSSAQGNIQCTIHFFINLFKVLCWELEPLEKNSIYFKVLELSSALENIWWMNNLSTNLPQTLGVKNLSRNIRKKKLLLNSAFLSTCEFKNPLQCLGEHSMCHPSCCKPPPSDTLGE